MLYNIHQYRNKELRKTWAGYIETETHIIWLPANGGEPFVMERDSA